ncbi:hypothetical protein OG21DRAFT_93903 [Imleria badia]|nr:hypothetical protein OG21DRAFT_93903 [Imleria badia]
MSWHSVECKLSAANEGENPLTGCDLDQLVFWTACSESMWVAAENVIASLINETGIFYSEKRNHGTCQGGRDGDAAEVQKTKKLVWHAPIERSCVNCSPRTNHLLAVSQVSCHFAAHWQGINRTILFLAPKVAGRHRRCPEDAHRLDEHQVFAQIVSRSLGTATIHSTNRGPSWGTCQGTNCTVKNSVLLITASHAHMSCSCRHLLVPRSRPLRLHKRFIYHPCVVVGVTAEYHGPSMV